MFPIPFIIILSSNPRVFVYTHDTFQFGSAASQGLSSDAAAATVDREGAVDRHLWPWEVLTAPLS